MTDEEARKARAQRLRRKIHRIVEDEPQKKPADDSKPESARDFVKRRMRELDDKKP